MRPGGQVTVSYDPANGVSFTTNGLLTNAAFSNLMPSVFTGDDWGKIFANVPGGLDSYKRMEAKFTEALL